MAQDKLESPARRYPDNDDDDRYFTLTALTRYSGLSLSTLKRCLRDPARPLPHHLVRPTGAGRGRLLVRKAEFDEWVRQSRRGGSDTRTPRDHRPKDPRDPSWMVRAFHK